MVSKLKTDVLEKADGSPVDLTGQSAATSRINMNAGSNLINDSLNISSTIDNAAGDHTQNYTNSYANVSYSVSFGMSSSIANSDHGHPVPEIHRNNGNGLLIGSTRFRIYSIRSASFIDPFNFTTVVHGDLA